AERGGQGARLQPADLLPLGEGPRRARRSLLAQDPRLPGLRPPAGARGLWWADWGRAWSRRALPSGAGPPARAPARRRGLLGARRDGPCILADLVGLRALPGCGAGSRLSRPGRR